MDSSLAIKVDNLSKIYPIYEDKKDRMKEALSLTRKKYHEDFHALNHVSFEIRKGETLGIIGQNGSGKSTLLKILTGVLSQSSGDVCVDGKVSALLELGAGFNLEMTGIENIFLNGTIMGYTREEMKERIPKIVDFADIGEFVDQPVKMYSSGMFARLAFAVAINVEPDILIVDEALSVGDMRFQIKCMNHMKRMIDGGTTVIFVSHDINIIRRFCTKAIWLNKGKVMQIGEVNDTADTYLDFLKTGVVENDKRESHDKVEEKPFVPGDNIAEIMEFTLSNELQDNVSLFGYDEKMIVQVVYDVYDTNIENPVLGIAIRSCDGDYICGVNTLLDDTEIPWKYGRNRFSLEYSHGICVVGGNYEFDVALFEKTATVPIHYMSKIKSIKVVADYVGEGRLIIPHNWKRTTENE